MLSPPLVHVGCRALSPLPLSSTSPLCDYCEMSSEKEAERTQLLPSYEAAVPRPHRHRAMSRVYLLPLVLTSWLLLFHANSHASSLFKHKHKKHHHHDHGRHRLPVEAQCPAQVDPIDRGGNWDPAADQSYRAKAAERLQGAVQVATVYAASQLSISLLTSRTARMTTWACRMRIRDSSR